MPWTCRLIPEPELDSDGHLDISKREIGDIWYATEDSKYIVEMLELSDYYWQHNSHRPPIWVVLPSKHSKSGKTRFCVDSKCYSREKGYYGGWTVTGEPPNITVNPSINIEYTYHG